MTAGEVIEIVEDLEPSVYSDETLLMFINELEMKLRRKVERSTAYITFKREVDQKEYNMYSLTGMLDDKYNSERMDFNFSNIMSVLINGEKINHVGLDHDESLPGYRMAQNTNLELFPVVTSEPSEDDVKVIFLAPGNALDMEIDYLTELVGSEFKEMYYLYVIAKINFYNRDFAAYNNFIDQHNDVLEMFLTENIRKSPINKQSNKLKNIW